MTTTEYRPDEQSFDQTEESESAPRRGPWVWVLVAALAGIGLTTVQIMEKVDILAHPGTVLFCDASATVSCSNVLSAWQSSVLGPPNALIGAIMFALLGSAGLAGVLASRPSRAYLLTMLGLAVFFLCFASWFMFQTAFVIGSLCVWCTGIVTAVVVICAALLRIAVRQRAFGQDAVGHTLDVMVGSYLDLALWAVWLLAIAAMLWVGLFA